MNLENRKIMCEDIGYQILFRRERIAADELGKKIGKEKQRREEQRDREEKQEKREKREARAA